MNPNEPDDIMVD
jgi:hypothetical protein